MKSTNGILKEARKLISRAPPFQNAELRVILDAAEHIPRDGPISHTDSRILRAADRLAPFYAEREPKPPSPFDDRIEAALEVESKMEAMFEEAGEERWARVLDLEALTGGGSVILRGRSGPATFWTPRATPGSGIPDRALVDRATLSAQASQEALDLAEAAFKRARVAKNELEHARGRWRAVAPLVVD